MGPWGFSEFHRGYLSEFNRQRIDRRRALQPRRSRLAAAARKTCAQTRRVTTCRATARPIPYPPESVGGPMVAMTNQFAGSDGDIFSHCFKLYKLGPLVGKAHVGRRHRHRAVPPSRRRHADDATGVFVLVHRRRLESRELRHRSGLRRRHRAARLSRRPRSADGFCFASDGSRVGKRDRKFAPTSARVHRCRSLLWPKDDKSEAAHETVMLSSSKHGRISSMPVCAHAFL